MKISLSRLCPQGLYLRLKRSKRWKMFLSACMSRVSTFKSCLQHAHQQAGACGLLAATTFQALTMLPLVGGSRYQQHQSMHCSALTSTPKTGQIAAAAEQQAQAAVRQGARGGISGMGWAIEAASYGLHQMSCKPSAAERGGTMWCDAELAAGCCCHVSFVT